MDFFTESGNGSIFTISAMAETERKLVAGFGIRSLNFFNEITVHYPFKV